MNPRGVAAEAEIVIPTEHPEEEQWRLLSRLTYPANIRKYMEANGHGEPTVEATEFISGCIRQSEGYFNAAREAPLDISPLLLYYGTTNLLAGAGWLLRGQRLPIRGHGLKLGNSSSRVADVEVRTVDAKTGGLHHFASVFAGNAGLVGGNAWRVEELFASIPDLRQEFLMCYPRGRPANIPLEVVETQAGHLDRILPSDLSRFSDVEEALSLVDDLKQAYLSPQFGQQMNYVVLRRKLGGSEIATHSLFGQRYLLLAHIKGGQRHTLTPLLAMVMSLYALAFISRYQPEMWSPFIRTDTSGEVLLVVKLLAICQRHIPNLVLDHVHKRRHRFVQETHGTTDQTALSSVEELRREIASQIDNRLAKLGLPK